jgi:2'-5' RNA ligase
MIQENFYSQNWEYLLIISPPEEIKRLIGNIKKAVGIKYNSSQALHSTAYISIVKFVLQKNYERHLLTRLLDFFINKLSFCIQLNNFDVFPKHTLYIDIPSNMELKKLQNELIFFLMSSVLVRGKYLKAGKKFHMTIARSLRPEQFELISKDYRNKTLSAEFPAKEIVLLKRPYDEYNARSCRWNGSHSFIMGI